MPFFLKFQNRDFSSSEKESIDPVTELDGHYRVITFTTTMSSFFSLKSSLTNLMGMMDGICCAQTTEEQYNEATREQLEQFFALYDMKQTGPGSEISTATTMTMSNSMDSRYTVFADKR